MLVDYFTKWQGIADAAQQKGNDALELWASLALIAPFAVVFGAVLVAGFFLGNWLKDNYYI